MFRTWIFKYKLQARKKKIPIEYIQQMDFNVSSSQFDSLQNQDSFTTPPPTVYN